MRFPQLIAAIFVLLAVPCRLPAQAEGIFADFLTSMGNFTARLYYENSPATVANFVGLAEGSRAWVDARTGAVVTGKPYYNGLIFHRVIEGFMSQTGCQFGVGSTGPGYQIRDELISNGLFHDSPYLLSMATAGPNSGGSQFFITAVPRPDLNPKHTVFGSITSGHTVVDAINGVATNPLNDRPLTDVVIQSVVIRRVGANAQAFDVQTQGVPVCSWPMGELVVEPNQFVAWAFQANPGPGSVVSVHRSVDLSNWAATVSSYRGPIDSAYSALILDNGSLDKAFYQFNQVDFPGAFQPGPSAGPLANTLLRITIGDSSSDLFSFQFNGEGSGGNGALFLGGEQQNLYSFILLRLEEKPYGMKLAVFTTIYGIMDIRCGYDGTFPSAYFGRHLTNCSNIIPPELTGMMRLDF